MKVKGKQVIIISALVGAIVGGSVALLWQYYQKPTEDKLIRDFYLTENAVYISPHGLRKKMDKGEKDYILVDLRSSQEYEKEHVVGAINIPAYKDPDTSAYEEIDRIVSEFRKLPSDKEVIVYCYSISCMTGRKVGKILAEYGIFVKHLAIGWNEWRHFWNLWNHEHEWSQVTVEDYIVSGKDPGWPQVRELPSPCGEGELSC